jgi:hydrogenase expression/formation protein HypD
MQRLYKKDNGRFVPIGWMCPDCKLFGKVCNPRRPVGPCMVSHEGACKIWHMYQMKKP